jgi:TolB-like protein/Flp pilus assembly protein TadD
MASPRRFNVGAAFARFVSSRPMVDGATRNSFKRLRVRQIGQAMPGTIEVSASSFVRELQRRNVFRATVLYATSVWALAQGIASLGPTLGAPGWATRWFLVAAVIGFPFWIAFTWFYELTPEGIRRESEVEADTSILRATGRRLDFLIIGVLAVAVVLLLTDRFVLHDKGGVSAAAVAGKSIAVLPLANESGDASMLYFSDGLSEGFINALSQFAGLKVIARTSSFQFRNSKDPVAVIGGKLGVAHLLEGSVQRAGDTVRISAELVNTQDGATLWAEHYDRPYKDLFQLEDEITNSVAAALKTKLMGSAALDPQSDRPPSGSLDAYDAYLQASFHWRNGSPAGQTKAIADLRRAIQIDPDYAQAWARLSIDLTQYAWIDANSEQARRLYRDARAAAAKAIALAPNSAESHVAMGTILETDFDWPGAEREFRRATALAPKDPGVGAQLAAILATLGKLDESAALYRRILVADPLRAASYSNLSLVLMGKGNLDEAERLMRRAIALAPDAKVNHEELATIFVLRGDATAALREAQQEPDGLYRDVGVAIARRMAGDRKAADAALNDAISRYSDAGPYQIAEIYAGYHDADTMFEWLERARALADPGLLDLLDDPLILRYRHDPRFAKLCAELKLPLQT